MNVSKALQRPFLITPRTRVEQRNKPPRPCKKYVKVAYCLFDLDGSILDNHLIMHCAQKSVFEKYKLEYTPEWNREIMGMTGPAMWKKVVKEHKLKVPWETLNTDYNNGLKENLENLPTTKGIDRLVDHLVKHGINMAIVTSSNQETMEKKTAHIKELISKFSHVTCGEGDPEIKESKPLPEIYTACINRFKFKPEPEICLTFENTHNGIYAALRACIQVVGVYSEPTRMRSLRHANEILKSYDEFLPGKYGMPRFPGQEPIALF